MFAEGRVRYLFAEGRVRHGVAFRRPAFKENEKIKCMPRRPKINMLNKMQNKGREPAGIYSKGVAPPPQAMVARRALNL